MNMNRNKNIHFTWHCIQLVRCFFYFKHHSCTIFIRRTYWPPLLQSERKQTLVILHFLIVLIEIAHWVLTLVFIFFLISVWKVGSSNHCYSNHTAWIETDGGNRHPGARGLCSIDQIALIKVVCREKTTANDGWLLVIMQQCTNITPLICGMLQSVRITLTVFSLDKKNKNKTCSWHLLTHLESVRKSDGLRADGSNRYGQIRRWERKLCVCDHSPPQDKVREHKWKDKNVLHFNNGQLIY